MNNIPELGLWFDWLRPYHLRNDKEYNGKPPVPPRTNDTIALKRYLDSEFYGEVTVGNKSVETFNVVFDTAWVHSWLISSRCPESSPGCGLHTKYDHDASSTYIEDGEKYSSKEGNYTLTGFWSIDFFYLSHSNITNQSFIEMTDIPDINLLTKADGVFGLGLKVSDRKPFFYNLVEQGKIKEPIFSIYLNRDSSSSRGGSIFLGGFEPKHVHVTDKIFDQFTEVPVISNLGYWDFKLDMVAFNIAKKLLPFPCSENCSAIIDSSSMDILTSQANIEAINKKIHAKPFAMGLYTVDCTKINKLPAFVFVIQNKNFTLTGQNYISRATIGQTTVCISSFKSYDSLSQDVWVLGGAFLSEYYSVYNIDKRTISFVKAA